MSLQPFFIALQFLTIIPVTLETPVKSSDTGQSLLYYPMVGAIIGMLLIALAMLLQAQATTISAVIILLCWVVITGGLHIDGLADSADAWLGGLGNSDKTLTIMKDPSCGPIAVITLVLLLLVKFVMLATLLEQQHYWPLLWSIVAARTAMPLLFLTTAYIRRDGLGAKLKQQQPIITTRWLLASIAVLFWLSSGILVLLVFLAVFLILRYLMEQRLGGFTGDTAGATVEIIEASLLTFYVLTIGTV